MNKSKFVKILVAVLSFCLLLGAIVGIAASAQEDSVTPEISFANVEYGSRTYLYYAVDPDTIPEADKNAENGFWLQVNNTDGSLVFSKVYPQAQMAKIDGKDYYVFITRGVPAKELNTLEVVKVVTVSGAESESLTYSAEDYLYNRLYTDGFAKKTEADGEDYLKRTLYYDLLKYGTVAQELLAPNAEDKIADTAYATAPGAVATLGKLNPGTEVVLAYDASSSDKAFAAWAYSQYDRFGEVIGSGYATDKSSFVVDGYLTATPVYDETEYVYDPCDSVPSGILSPAGNWAVGTDPKNAENNTYVTDRDSNNSSGSSYWYRINSANKKENATAAIFSTKIYWENTANIVLEIRLLANNSSSQRVAFIYFNSNTARFYENGAAATAYSTPKTRNAWHDIRVEYRVLDVDGVSVPETKLFVDDTLIDVTNELYEKSYYTNGVLDNSKVPAPSSIYDTSVLVSSSIKQGDVHFDDMMITHTDAPTGEVIGYEEGVVGMHDSLSTLAYGSSDAHATTTHGIVSDPVTGNSVLKISKSAGNSGGGINFTAPTYKESGANLMVLQLDMFVDTKADIATYLDFEVRFGNGSSDPNWKVSPFGISFNKCSVRDAWVTIRIEYRVLETDESGNVTKAQVTVLENGKTRSDYIMSSDKNGDGIRDEASDLIPNGGTKNPTIENFGKCLIRLNYSNKGCYYFDNMSYMLIKE